MTTTLGDDGAAPVVETTTTTIDMEAVCIAYGASISQASDALIASLDALTVAQLAGVQPFFESYVTAVADAGRVDGADQCDSSVVTAEWTRVVNTPSSSAPSSVVRAALAGSPPTDAAAAAATLGAVAAFERSPVPVGNPDDTDRLPKWISILASLPTDSWTEAAALVEADRLAGPGVTTNLLLSDDFGSLNNGYWVVYTGTYDERIEARNFCSGAGSGYDICYDRYLQYLPQAVEPFAGCGEWGSYRVTGGSMAVRTGPTSGHPSIGSFGNGTQGVLAAGPPMSVGGDLWTPVAYGQIIGWASSDQLQREADCVGVRDGFSVLVCADVSRYAVETLSGAVTVADTSGSDAAPAWDAPWDRYLAERAGELGCNTPNLNATISAEVAAIQPTTPLGRAVRLLLASTPFFGS